MHSLLKTVHNELYRYVAGLTGTGTMSPWPTSLTSLPSFQAAGFCLDDLPPSSLLAEICQLSEKLVVLQEELHTLKAVMNGGEGMLQSEAEGTIRSVSPPPLGSPPPTSCATSTHPPSTERLSFDSTESCYSVSGSNAYFPRMLMETESEEVQQSLIEMLQGRHALGTQVSTMTVAAPWLDELTQAQVAPGRLADRECV